REVVSFRGEHIDLVGDSHAHVVSASALRRLPDARCQVEQVPRDQSAIPSIGSTTDTVERRVDAVDVVIVEDLPTPRATRGGRRRRAGRGNAGPVASGPLPRPAVAQLVVFPLAVEAIAPGSAALPHATPGVRRVPARTAPGTGIVAGRIARLIRLGSRPV